MSNVESKSFPTLSDKITILQQARNISGAEIARILEVNQAVLTRIKKHNQVDSIHIPAIADILGTSSEYLAEAEYIPRFERKAKRPKLVRIIEKLIAANKLTPDDQKLLLSLATELSNRAN